MEHCRKCTQTSKIVNLITCSDVTKYKIERIVIRLEKENNLWDDIEESGFHDHMLKYRQTKTNLKENLFLLMHHLDLFWVGPHEWDNLRTGWRQTWLEIVRSFVI